MGTLLTRCILSSGPPIFAYMLGYMSISMFGKEMAPFLNWKAGFIIAIISLLWPLQQLSMACVFEPIVFLLRWKLRSNPPLSKTKKDQDGKPLTQYNVFERRMADRLSYFDWKLCYQGMLDEFEYLHEPSK